MDKIAKQTPPRNPYAELGEGVAGLRSAVSDLFARYERLPALNELQPPSLAPCFPFSLDEWLHYLADAIGDIAMLRDLWESLGARGFAPEVGGGGISFLSAARGAAAVWLTGEDGAGFPRVDSWMVGVYPPAGLDGDGRDPLWTLRSDTACNLDINGLGRLMTAVDAALVTADAIGGGPDKRHTFHAELDRLLDIDAARQDAVGEVETGEEQRANDIIAMLSIGLRQAETRAAWGLKKK